MEYAKLNGITFAFS